MVRVPLHHFQLKSPMQSLRWFPFSTPGNTHDCDGQSMLQDLEVNRMSTTLNNDIYIHIYIYIYIYIYIL